ncbi:MAG: pseudouridine synthase [bacterium]
MSKLLLFNKPYDVLSQFTDREGRSTLADYIDIPGVYPAGRLDRDSEGLLLLTDDGRLAHQLTHPDKQTWKEYWVQVEGNAGRSQIKALQRGVQLNDGPTLPAKVKTMKAPQIWERDPPIRYRANIPTSWIRISIQEGRNRQVRRMTANVGLPTLRLIRVAIGQWRLQELQPGEYQVINRP